MGIKDKAKSGIRILSAAVSALFGKGAAALVRMMRLMGAPLRWWKLEKSAPFYGIRRLFRWAFATGLIALGICIAADQWLGYRFQGRIYASAREVPSKTVAIVLGAAVYPGGRPSPVLEDRLLAAEKLYRLHKVRKILVSGDHGKKRYDETTAMHRFLQKRRIPERDIFLDHAGFRTLDTMFRAAMVFRVEDAVICTQRFHLARSLFLAEQAGIDAVGLVSDQRRYRNHFFNVGREVFASFTAVLDVYVIGRKPRFLGAPISILGNGQQTQE